MRVAAASRTAVLSVVCRSPEKHRRAGKQFGAGLRDDEVFFESSGPDPGMRQTNLRRHHHAGFERYIVMQRSVAVRFAFADGNGVGNEICGEAVPQQWNLQLWMVEVAMLARDRSAKNTQLPRRDTRAHACHHGVHYLDGTFQ